MKAAISLTLVLALITSAQPLTAQARIDGAEEPIGRATSIETARPAPGPDLVDAGQQTGASPTADWSRVRMLEPGTKITVTTTGSPLGERYVLSTSESGITTLNLTDPTLPARAREALRYAAERNPALLTGPQQGGTVPVEKNVRLMSGGVFVADRKVADLGSLVDTVARADVVEITGIANVRSARNVLGGTLIGAAAGGVIGYAAGACKPDPNAFFSICLRSLATVFIAVIGAGVGAAIGALITRRKVRVIYRVP